MKLPFRKASTPVVPQRNVRGGSRAPVYSYYASRSSLQDVSGRQRFRQAISPTKTKRAVGYTLRRFGATVAVLAILASTISILSLSSDSRVLPADPGQRIFIHDPAVYRQAADRLLAGSILNRSKLTVNGTSVEAALQAEFPDLKSVVIKLPLIDRRPIVYLLPARPVAILEDTQRRLFILDENGRLIARADEAYDHHVTTGLPLVRDDAGVNISVGAQVLPVNSVIFFQEVQYQLSHASLRSSVYVLPAGKSELDAYIEGQPFFAKFNLSNDTAQQQTGTFLAVRHHLQGEGIVPSQYIDVRVDGRAYYK